MSTERSLKSGTLNGTHPATPQSKSSTDMPPPPEKFPFAKTITHLKQFPVVSDSIQVISSHPLGQRSISISTTAYDKFVKPFSPYLIKANDIAYPYVNKADELTDLGIGKVEEKFPILKEPTENLTGYVNGTVGMGKQYAMNIAGKGYELANEKREHVIHVFQEELQRDGGSGYIPTAKAGITTSFVVAAEVFQTIIDILQKKGTEDAQNGVPQNGPVHNGVPTVYNEKPEKPERHRREKHSKAVAAA